MGNPQLSRTRPITSTLLREYVTGTKSLQNKTWHLQGGRPGPQWGEVGGQAVPHKG